MTAMKLHRYGASRFGKIGAGARMVRQGPTARDYVQDGLVAMWDGIENAGWGVHDPDATTWKDLSGNGYDLALDHATTIGSNFIQSGDDTRVIAQLVNTSSLDMAPITTALTYETVAEFPSTDSFLFYLTTNPRYSIGVVSGYIQAAYRNGTDVLATGQTAHVCGVVNAADPQYAAAQYVGGVAQSLVTRIHTDGTSGINLNIGYGRTGEPFRGVIHRLAFYSRALTAEEIAANHAIDKARFNLP